MENQRIFLWAALGFISLLLFQTWQADYGPKPVPRTEQVAPDNTGNQTLGPSDSQVDSFLPPTAQDSVEGDATDSQVSPGINAVETGANGQTVFVETDVVRVEISTVGGTISAVALKKYPVSIKEPEEPFILASDRPGRFLVAKSGLEGFNDKELPSPNHVYKALSTNFVLADNADSISVPLVWEEDNLKVTKLLTFKRDSYEIDVSFKIENGSEEPLSFAHYYFLQRKPVTSDETSQLVRTYTGAVISTEEERYQKVDFGDMEDEPLNINSKGGWIAMIQHYFGAAWIPPQTNQNVFFSRHLPGQNFGPDYYLIGMKSGKVAVAAGGVSEVSAKAYIGPKIQELLKESAPHLELSVDFGWLTILAQPLFWLLIHIHAVVGNWGWAIILLTCLIKLFFYPLSQAGYKSMARMKKLQPKMVALKERYGDDRAKMGQKTMELYKKEKVNPLGGCLPMIVQIPVFIALYWMLIESVELRQAPWILWIKDLADKDPFFILPVIMGITMFIQQKLNPAPVDPIQAKVFMFLPFVFTAFFAFFPAGLVLYWIVNNTLSIAQQYYITRYVIGVE